MMKRFKRVYFEILFLIGLVLSTIVSFDQSANFLPEFIKGMFSGLSVVFMIVAGFIKFNKKIQDRLKVADNDERIKAIEGKASTITLYAVLFFNVICIVVFGFMGDPFIWISIVLALIMFAGIVVLFLAKLILSKRM